MLLPIPNSQTDAALRQNKSNKNNNKKVRERKLSNAINTRTTAKLELRHHLTDKTLGH